MRRNIRQAALLPLLLLFAWLAAPPMAALADSWVPPHVETYYSPDKGARFTVTPRGIESPLAYFDGKVKNESLAGQKTGASPFARGVLERKDFGDRWVIVWDKQLVNDVAPVSAVVANSALSVVTFDNWHSAGYGDDAVVIYGEGGKLIRSFALTDLLPDYYFKALPRSASSTGQALPASGADWEKARLAARKIAAERQKAEDKWNAWFRNPLVAPKTAKNTDWMPYLYEVFSRLDPNWKLAQSSIGNNPVEIILPSAGSTGLGHSPEELRNTFLERPEPHVVMIASPGDKNEFAKVLAPVLAKAKRGAFKGWRIYVVCPPDYRERMAALFAPTEATFIHVDPAVGIPQRPERLRERGLEP
jgi:hypothetical protein